MYQTQQITYMLDNVHAKGLLRKDWEEVTKTFLLNYKILDQLDACSVCKRLFASNLLEIFTSPTKSLLCLQKIFDKCKLDPEDLCQSILLL